MWSYVECRCLAMGYVIHDEGVIGDWLDAGGFEIEVATERIPATPSIRSFYDPRNLRVKVWPSDGTARRLTISGERRRRSTGG